MKNFNEIYNEVRPVVLGYLTKQTRDRELAEDLTNDAMLKMYENLHRFDETKASMSTWTVNIAKNLLIDHWRKRRVETSSMDNFINDNGEYNVQTVADSTPHTMMVSQQIAEGIELAFNKLPENYRKVAELYFKKQYSYEEVSDETQKPLGTIKANIHRIRKMLQTELATA